MTAKEKLFCRYFFFVRDVREAALRAGYPAKKAMPAGMKLMDREDIKAWLKILMRSDAEETDMTAVMGLRRIAFGAGNDAMQLVRGEENFADEEIGLLDLFNVSEIKRQKGGGLEIKFYDRLKALEMLLEWGEKKRADSSAGSIYEALENSTLNFMHEFARDENCCVEEVSENVD